MNSLLSTLTFLFLLIANAAYTQTEQSPYKGTYDLNGVSGSKERFAPTDYLDDAAQRQNVLYGADSLKTIVRGLSSSYDRLKYLIFDNHYQVGSEHRNEINLQSIYGSFERPRPGDWNLISQHRLTNDNILVVVGIYIGKSSLVHIHRFMVFDKTGANLLSRKDYSLLETPRVLVEDNGGFLIVINKDYAPVLVEDYINFGNGKLNELENVFRNSFSAISITRFDSEARFVSKQSYLVHSDSNINKDHIFDVISHEKFHYVLLSSNMAGIMNQPTLTALMVSREQPTLYAIETLVEPNAIIGIENAFFKKENSKLYASLQGAGKQIEIKSNLYETHRPSSATQPRERVRKSVVDSAVFKGNNILVTNGIAYKCISYHETNYGIFIGVRDQANNPINFIYDAGTLKEVPQLKSYVIVDFNRLKNRMLLGYHSPSDKMSETMTKQFFLYNPQSRVLVEQVKYGSEVYRAQLTYEGDSIACFVNTKNADGIGSSIVRLVTKLRAD